MNSSDESFLIFLLFHFNPSLMCFFDLLLHIGVDSELTLRKCCFQGHLVPQLLLSQCIKSQSYNLVTLFLTFLNNFTTFSCNRTQWIKGDLFVKYCLGLGVDPLLESDVGLLTIPDSLENLPLFQIEYKSVDVIIPLVSVKEQALLAI